MGCAESSDSRRQVSEKTVKKIIDEEPQGTAPAGKSPAEEVVEDTAVEAAAEEADFENAGSQEA